MYVTKDNDIWVVERNGVTWGNPQLLPSPINSEYEDGSYSETSDSIVYIERVRPGDNGNYDIWSIQHLPDQSLKAEKLGSIINSTPRNLSSCIAPDGSYLIYTQSNGSYEHFFTSFKKGNNEWTTPINMDRSGAGINTLFQTCPTLSPDGKYLFFNKHIPNIANSSDIYRVSTHVIDTLKKIAMPTVSVMQTVKQNAKLFPNPTTGKITIANGRIIQLAYRKIYNIDGRQILIKAIQNTTSATIDLTGKSEGIYLVKVIADGVSYEEKIVKE